MMFKMIWMQKDPDSAVRNATAGLCGMRCDISLLTHLQDAEPSDW